MLKFTTLNDLTEYLAKWRIIDAADARGWSPILNTLYGAAYSRETYNTVKNLDRATARDLYEEAGFLGDMVQSQIYNKRSYDEWDFEACELTWLSNLAADRLNEDH